MRESERKTRTSWLHRIISSNIPKTANSTLILEKDQRYYGEDLMFLQEGVSTHSSVSG